MGRYYKVCVDLPSAVMLRPGLRTELREVHRYVCPLCGYGWESPGAVGEPTPIACLECGNKPEGE
jgi:hypothetical protein